MKSLPGERYLAISFIIFSVIVLYLSYNISGFESLYSPGSTPLFTSFILMVFSIGIYWGIKTKVNYGYNGTKKEIIETIKMVFPIPVIIFITTTIIYVILISKLGFIIASFIFVWFLFIYFNKRKKTNNIISLGLKSGLLSVIIVMIIYLLFHNVFGVLLP